MWPHPRGSQKSEASLLAARFLLKRFPGLLLDKYDGGQEHVHRGREDEAAARNSWAQLAAKVHQSPSHAGQSLRAAQAGTPEVKRTGESDYYGENCLHLAIVNRLPEVLLFAESLECSAKGGPPPQGDREETLQCGLPFLKTLANGRATGSFFQPGGLCDYGGLPLNFAAATGAPLWCAFSAARGGRNNLKPSTPDPC